MSNSNAITFIFESSSDLNITYDSSTVTTFEVLTLGTGDVTSSATAAASGNFARYSSTTGHVIEDSGYGITDFAAAAHSHSASYLGLSATAVDSKLLDGLDSTYFAVAVHSHVAADVTAATPSGLFLQDNGTWGTPAGSGDVSGPSSSATNNFASFADDGGKTLVDSGYRYTDFALSAHSHSASYLGLSATAVDSKLLDGMDSTAFAVAAHAHSSATYLPTTSLVSMEVSGFVSYGGSGDYYSLTTAGVFTVLREGQGMILGVPITWAGGEHVHLTANKGYFIGYSATNTLVAIDFSTVFNADIGTYHDALASAMKNNVFLFSVWYDGSENIVAKNNHPYSYPSDISSHDHFRLGSVFIGTGAVISLLSAANRTIDLIGADFIDDHGNEGVVPDSTGVAISVVGIWKNGSSVAQRFHRRNFTVSGVSTAPTAGATYTSATGKVFTVLFTNTAKTLIETWGSTWIGEPDASGTLTRVSGTGDNSISYSAVATNRVVPTSYLSGGTAVPLSGSGGTRFGIYAIYALLHDMQTPSTASPQSVFFVLLSATAYGSAAAAASSLGTGAGPLMTQFVMPDEFNALEPVLLGFVISDGNDRKIDAYTGAGFTNGVRSYKQTSTTSFSAGAVAITAAGNVLTVTSAFGGALGTDDTDVQKALDTLDDHTHTAYAAAIHSHSASYLGLSATAVDSKLLDGYDSTAFAVAAHSHSTATYAAAAHSHSASYLGLSATAVDSALLDGQDSTYFATAVHSHSSATYSLAGHSHSASYLGLSATAVDSALLDGQDSTYFAVAVHSHSTATYAAAAHTHSMTYASYAHSHAAGDADTLDGQDSTYYAVAVHTHSSATYAPTTHYHAAADITSGTLSGARLPAMSAATRGGVPATGAPSGKYLKDNGTWDDPAGSGDVSGPASSATNNFASFADDDGKTLADSGYKYTSFSLSGHNHSLTYASYTHTHTGSIAIETTLPAWSSAYEGRIVYDNTLNKFYAGSDLEWWELDLLTGNRGVLGGGSAPMNTIQYINIATAGNGLDFGDLTVSNGYMGAGSSRTRGIFAGGTTDGGGTASNVMNMITFSTTGDASDWGDLTVARYSLAGVSNKNRVCFAGGETPGGTKKNEIDWALIASTGTAVDFNDLITGTGYIGGGINSTTRGVFSGGLDSGPYTKVMEYITIMTAGAAGDFGDLVVARYNTCGLSSATRGLIGGGHEQVAGAVDTIEYITIASTGDSADFHNLTRAVEGQGAMSNSVTGLFASAGGIVNVDWVTIASAAAAQDFGDMFQATNYSAGCSDSHGGL